MKRADQGGKMDGPATSRPTASLGPYREKEGSFFAIKEIWSPIVVKRDAASGELTIENRYDFTNTSQCAFTWQLRKFRAASEQASDFTVVGGGKSRRAVNCAARQRHVEA